MVMHSSARLGIGAGIQLLGGGTVAPVNAWRAFRQRAGELFSRQWWVGVGVVLATIVAIVGYLLASGEPSTSSEVNTVHGSCNAAGNNNTINCPNSTSGTGR